MLDAIAFTALIVIAAVFAIVGICEFISRLTWGVTWEDEHESQDWRTLWDKTDGRKK